MKYEIVKGYQSERFKTATGVSRETFDVMCEVLKEAYKKRHGKHNGRHRKLCIEDMLLATLEYLYEYRTYECIGASYGLNKQNMQKNVRWVENELIKCGLFNLPGKKKLCQSEVEFEVVIVDTSESPIERPEKGQKKYYSGKKNGTH